MASNFRLISVNIFALCFTFPLLFLSTAAVPDRELELMIAVMRTRGYTLFGNAITTSDVYYDILAGDSFTFFAPTDSSLFALDMTASASDYISTLHHHIVPRRLPLARLRSLPSGSTLETLSARHSIHVQRRPVSNIISVDGVDVVLPGLFYGTSVVVHGLGGILSFRSQRNSPRTPVNLASNQDSPPPVAEHHHDLPSPANIYDNHNPSPTPQAFGNENPRIGSPVSGSVISESSDRLSPANSLAQKSYTAGISPASSARPSLSPDYVAASSPLIETHQAPPGEGWPLVWPILKSTERDEVLQIEEAEENNGASGDAPLGTTEVIPWPFDPETLSCPVKGTETLFGHVSIQPGNPIALHSTLTCA